MSQFHLSLCILVLTSTYSVATKFSNETFTFAKQESFFNVEPEWPLSSQRQVSFHFRTEHPQGLLLYHGIKNLAPNSTYELYLMLDNGQIKIIHIFYQDGRDVESFSVGKGLNTDKWHHVHIFINPEIGELKIEVDGAQESKILQSLVEHPFYGMKTTTTNSFLYFGGMDPQNPVWNQQYNYVRFVGCMRDVRFSHSNEPLEPVKLGNHSQLDQGCLDQCKKQDMCQNKGRCINHYVSTSCDCFGTQHENGICSSANLTMITLRGNSFLTYHVFDWRDKVHSEPTRISMTFKTVIPESVLFYGAGRHPVNNYLILNLIKGSLFFEIDFGDGPLTTIMGRRLDDERWHNVTVVRYGRRVVVHLDRHMEELNVTGHHHHLHFDPEVYIGGLSPRSQGLNTRKMFVGCLREVYLNDQNILYSLRGEKDVTVRHHGVIPVEYGCKISDVVPVTFSSIGGFIVVNGTGIVRPRYLSLSIEFRTSKDNSYLASGLLRSEAGNGTWEIAIQKGSIFVIIIPDITAPLNKWELSEGMNLIDNLWHQVDFEFNEGRRILLTVDFRHTTNSNYQKNISFFGDIVIGSNVTQAKTEFIGCLRDLQVNGVFLDPRDFSPHATIVGKLSLDTCRFVNPCSNPRACEHGGKCYVESGRKACNCTGTGYTGETCHFASYKRTCEELYLLGYRESGVYKIDIDRNGPMPPAHVFCDMDPGDGSIATRVENNLPAEMVVRKAGMEGFYMNITYRDFTPEMLQSLIDQSKHCSQHFKYECHLTPLGLYTYTWMVSSFGNIILHVGDAKPGHCMCGKNKTCANPYKLCNCDSADRPWRTDEGTYSNPEDLGITKLFILQPKKMDKDAQARINLGPLECVETDTQLYVITFKTKHSYLEVPGWRNGDMAFSFRTSNDRAVLLYQASAHTDHGYFRVLLTSDHELSFEFTVNGVPRSVKVISRRRLNSGEWQQVWVDHDTHHMRFTINLDSVMIDLADEEVGPFEGPMFIGAVPGQFAKDSPIKQGFIGCFRGLVINNAVVDVYQYLTRRAADIATGCKPSCLPNPCQNEAICHEFWGTYQCECINPAAHSGVNCEKNINENSMTFLTEDSYYHNKTDGVPPNSLLDKDFLVSFRTNEKEALILYAFDHNNNFVQLHVSDNKVYLTYNSNRTIVDGFVASKDISKGYPIQVIVERSDNETSLTVQKETVIISHPKIFMQEYSQKPFGDVDKDINIKELVLPSRGAFPTVAHNQVFLGGVSEPKDGMISHIKGFIGSIQGLKIGDEQFDLKKAALTPEAHGDIVMDYKMLCDAHPCHHGGLCIEGWKTNKTTCDCFMTSYIGETCDKEYGASFDGKTVVQYGFQMNGTVPDSLTIHAAFSTKDNSPYKRTLLMLLFAQSTNFILVALNPNGTLILEDYQKTKKIVFNAKSSHGTLVDGYRHWFRYTKTEENHILSLDGEMHSAIIKTVESSPSPATMSTITLGGQFTPQKVGDFTNFRGCMSNVFIMVNGVTMKPFETALGYEDNVSEVNKIRTQGDLSEEKCAAFAVGVYAETVVPSIPPEVTSEQWFREDPVMVPFSHESVHPEVAHLIAVSVSTGRVALVMAVLLVIVLMAIFLYVWKSQRKHKLLQFEEETKYFYTNKRPPTYPVKAVSFNDTKAFEEIEAQPLHQTPELADLRTKSYINNVKNDTQPYKDPEYSPNYVRSDGAISGGSDTTDALEIHPLRPTSSQELEWDPSGDTEDLIASAMEDDNEDDEDDEDESSLLKDDSSSPSPTIITNGPRKTAPLASTSEVPMVVPTIVPTTTSTYIDPINVPTSRKGRGGYRLDGRTGSLLFNYSPYE